MKWLPFAVLAVAAVVCQTTIVPQTMAVRSVWPEIPFILAVHYALWGPWPEAAIAAWLLGFSVDLCSADGPAPVHAFAYGAAAWAIIRLRKVLFRDHPGTHVVITLVFALGVQLLVGIYRAWRFEGGGETGLWGMSLGVAFYTAICAPFLQWGLLGIRRWTGLGPTRRSATF